MRRWRSLAGPLLAVSLGSVAFADGAAAQAVLPSAILTIDQDRLFALSAFGKAVLARETAAAQALEAENTQIEADLIAEEQSLTDRRAALSATDFSALATAFDEKVVRIRSEQDAKVRDLTRMREADRQAFFRAAVPVLGDLLVERQAVAIVDKSAIILSLTVIDVTDAAVTKVDAALGEGGTGTAVPGDLGPALPPAQPPAQPPAP